MPNVALGKPIEEPITNPTAATDGKTSEYSANVGFAEFSWPYMLTVDLGDIHRLFCIRLLLWDGLGEGNRQRDSRIYKYRLLTSADHLTWKVIYDSSNDGGNGWQVFSFPEAMDARYVRVHGIWNSANDKFQIVQVEAHDDTLSNLDAEIVLQRTVLSETVEAEVGDGMPLQARVGGIVNRIERLVEDNDLLNPQPFRQLILELRSQVTDVASLERGMDSIRREIITPVHQELKHSAKIGRFSVWLGLVGGVLAIISLFLPLWNGLRESGGLSNVRTPSRSQSPSDASASREPESSQREPIAFTIQARGELPHPFRLEGIWFGKFPDTDHESEFHVTGRIIVDGCIGSLIYKIANSDLELFIPDKGCANMNLQVRYKRGPWQYSGAMTNIP